MKNRDYNELTKKIDGMYWDTVDDHDRCKKMLERYVAEELATIEEEKLSYGKSIYCCPFWRNQTASWTAIR